MRCPICNGCGDVPEPPATPGVQLTLGGDSRQTAAIGQWREDLRTVHQELVTIGAPAQLMDAEYWLRIVQWLGGDNTRIVILDELRKYLAWLAGKPTRHRDYKRGFRNWLANAQRMEEQRDAREAQRGRSDNESRAPRR